jgi:NAD(P)-dependent dehydrogenase (short-subunit alcohol dehydrogenase family)
MTLPMARDLGRHGIRVVSVAPTLFVSAMSERMPEKTVKSLDRELVFPKRWLHILLSLFCDAANVDCTGLGTQMSSRKPSSGSSSVHT